jgi:hypothetical protein
MEILRSKMLGDIKAVRKASMLAEALEESLTLSQCMREVVAWIGPHRLRR